MKEDPIFIVGVPRSGTTLLAAMLAAHSRLSCGPETHFYRLLAKVNASQICRPENWPELAVDFVCSLKHSNFAGEGVKYIVDKYQLDRQAITTFLADKEPSISNTLASLTEQHMTSRGKSRWVEKTPDHIAYLESVRRNHPRSPIIQIVRDPRDVALSLTKVPWGARSFLEGLTFWRRLDAAGEEFFSSDPLSYLLRYEDLISHPREELQRLCRFLDEQFEENMLDTSSTGRQLNTMNVPWKDKASQPLDTSRIAVWHSDLTSRQNQLAEAIVGDRLLHYGYPREENFARLGQLFPANRSLLEYGDSLEELTSRGVRFWKAHESEAPTVWVYLGDPSADNWIGQKKPETILNTLSITANIIIRSQASHNSVYWFPGERSETWTGYGAHWLKKLLTPHKLETHG